MHKTIALLALLPSLALGAAGIATGRQTVSDLSALPVTAKDVDGTSIARSVKTRFENLVAHTAGVVNVREPPYNAVGNGVANDTAAVQAAASATPDGGTLLLSGSFLLKGSGAELLLLTKRINIVGVGWGSGFVVDASVGATTDVIHILPAAGVQGVRFENFSVSAASGTPARYGVNIDGTNAALGYLVLDHVNIGTLGSYAVAVTNAAGLVTGTPYTFTVGNQSVLSGGVNLTNAGDSIAIRESLLTGPRDLLVNLIGVAASDGGAHGFTLRDSNVTLAGGIVVVNAWQGLIDHCNIEQTVATTNSDGALISLRGNATAPPQGFVIQNTYIGSNSSFVTDAVRVDRMVNTIIRGNVAVRGSGVTYRLTANADRTRISENVQRPTGELITTWLADLGSNTSVDWYDTNSGTRMTTPSGVSTAGGAVVSSMTSAQLKIGSGKVLGFSSGTDPSITGLDSGLSRAAAGVFAAGNGSAADASGRFYASGYQYVSGSTTYSGSGAPATGLGNVGDFYFRSDTPGSANQRIYVKTGASTWVGIL